MAQDESTVAVDLNALENPEMFKRFMSKRVRTPSQIPVRSAQVKLSTKPENEDGFVEVTAEKPHKGPVRTSSPVKELIGDKTSEIKNKDETKNGNVEISKSEGEINNIEKWEEDEKQNEKKDDKIKDMQTCAVVTKEKLTTDQNHEGLRGSHQTSAENASYIPTKTGNEDRKQKAQTPKEENVKQTITYGRAETTEVTSSDSDLDSSDSSPIPSPPPNDGHIHFRLPPVVVSGDSGHESDSAETDESTESDVSTSVTDCEVTEKETIKATDHPMPSRDVITYQIPAKREEPDGECAPTNNTLRLSSRNMNKVIQDLDDPVDEYRPIEIPSGDESIKAIPIRQIFSNKKALRREIAKMDGLLKNMRRQRENLEYVYSVTWEWAEDLRNVERTKMGVPYFRAVKQIVAAQRKQLLEKHGEFSHRIKLLQEAETPGFANVHELIQNLKEFQTGIVKDERKYSAKNMEEIRQIIGQILGSTGSILEIFYEE